jgi:hypothetical protein
MKDGKGPSTVTLRHHTSQRQCVQHGPNADVTFFNSATPTYTCTSDNGCTSYGQGQTTQNYVRDISSFSWVKWWTCHQLTGAVNIACVPCPLMSEELKLDPCPIPPPTDEELGTIEAPLSWRKCEQECRFPCTCRCNVPEYRFIDWVW